MGKVLEECRYLLVPGIKVISARTNIRNIILQKGSEAELMGQKPGDGIDGDPDRKRLKLRAKGKGSSHMTRSA